MRPPLLLSLLFLSACATRYAVTPQSLKSQMLAAPVGYASLSLKLDGTSFNNHQARLLKTVNVEDSHGKSYTLPVKAGTRLEVKRANGLKRFIYLGTAEADSLALNGSTARMYAGGDEPMRWADIQSIQVFTKGHGLNLTQDPTRNAH